MKYKTILCAMIGLVCCLLLTNCHKDLLPGDYDAAEVGKIKKVVPGTIISIRPVRLHSKGNDSTNLKVSTGGYTDNSLNRTRGYEYVVRLNSGSIISVVQAEKIKFKNKQHILVIYGKNTRIVPDRGSEDY